MVSVFSLAVEYRIRLTTAVRASYLIRCENRVDCHKKPSHGGDKEDTTGSWMI